MIDGCFTFVRGVGPSRERELRRSGDRRWADYPEGSVVLGASLDGRVREGIARMRALVEERRWEEVSRRLPNRDRWRLYPHVAAEAHFLDIETTLDGGRVTVVGVYDVAGGPRVYVRGHNLGAFLDEPPATTIVTFNGLAFDVPVLRRTFPGWRPPPVHLDLRFVTRLAGERGGLKAIEERMGLARPEHLRGVNGLDAVLLWDRFQNAGDVPALRRLLEYNLYDVVQMRTVAEIACERLGDKHGTPWAPQRRFLRGDVLLDMTRCVERVVACAAKIVPDAVDDAERRALR